MPISPLASGLDAENEGGVSPYVASIAPFITSMFDSDVRSATKVLDAMKAGADRASFADPGSRKIILESWLAAWKVGVDLNEAARHGMARNVADLDVGPYKGYIRVEDQNFLQFVAAYVEKYNLSLCKRDIELSSLSIDPAAEGLPYYADTEYVRYPFKQDGQWSYGTFDAEGNPNADGTVVSFLSLLFHGAHFALICVADDGASSGMVSFDSAFNSFFGPLGKTRACPANSHYGGSYSGSDDYYLSVPDDNVPSDPSFILALLAGDTSIAGPSNSFMQLEGWQGQYSNDGGWGGPRHGQDNELHKATIWNISTFGASAYSEKRCTTVFLAQDTFPVTVNAATHMPVYEGAGTVQDWMLPGFLTGGWLDEVVTDVWDNIGHLYLFQGDQAIHYDPSAHKMHANSPQGIEAFFPGLAAAGCTSIDAAYSVPQGRGDDGGTYYFFSGPWYYHYTPKTGTISNHHIIPSGATTSDKWPGLKFPSLTAAAYRTTSNGDFIYFFNGLDSVRFNVKTQKTDHSSRIAASPDFSVMAAEMVSGRLNVFFKDEVIVWDVDSNALDTSQGVQAIYGKKNYRNLWWG